MEFFGFKKNDDDVKTDAQNSLPGTETTIDKTTADKATANDTDDIKHDDSDGDIKKPSTDEPNLGVFSAIEQVVEKLTDGPTTTTETDQEEGHTSEHDEESSDGEISIPSDYKPYEPYTLAKLDRDLHTAAEAMFPHTDAHKSNIWVLIIYWGSQEHMGGAVADIKEHLEPVFREKCGYITDTFKIPQDNPEQALVERLAEFVQLGGNSPDDVKIVYYAGYGRNVSDYEQVWTTDIRAGCPYESHRAAKSSEVSCTAVRASLKDCKSDLLYLLDCEYWRSWYHGRGNSVTEYIFSHQDDPFGHNELPDHFYSFTRAVADALNSLCAQVESGKMMPIFTVATLSTTIYHMLRENRPGREVVLLYHRYTSQDKADIRSIQLQGCDVPTHKSWRAFYLTQDLVDQLFASAPKLITTVRLDQPVADLVSILGCPFKILQSGFSALTKYIHAAGVYQGEWGQGTVLTLYLPKVLATYLGDCLNYHDEAVSSSNLFANNVIHLRGYDRADGPSIYQPALADRDTRAMAEHMARSMTERTARQTISMMGDIHARRIREKEDRYRDLNRRLNRVFEAIKAHVSSPFGLVMEVEGDDGDDSTTGSISGDGPSNGTNRGTDEGSSSDVSTTVMELPGLLREWLSTNQHSHDGSPPTVKLIEFWRQLELYARNSSQDSSEADQKLPGILMAWLMEYVMKHVLHPTWTNNVEVSILMDWLRLYEDFNRYRQRVSYEWDVSGSDHSEVSTESDSVGLDHLVNLAVDFAVRVDPLHREEVELATNLDKCIKAIYMIDARVNKFMDEILLPADAEDDNNSCTSSCDHPMSERSY
jgi:hypothetical protein